MTTALRSVGFLNVLSNTPAEYEDRAPCIHARLRCLATKPRERCGLEMEWRGDAADGYESPVPGSYECIYRELTTQHSFYQAGFFSGENHLVTDSL